MECAHCLTYNFNTSWLLMFCFSETGSDRDLKRLWIKNIHVMYKEIKHYWEISKTHVRGS